MDMVISVLKILIADESSGACAHSCARRIRDVSNATWVVSLVDNGETEEEAVLDGTNLYESGLTDKMEDGIRFTYS